MEITKELLEANGWSIAYHIGTHIPNLAYICEDGWYAEFQFGRNTIRIWSDYDKLANGDTYCDVYIRVCDTTEKLAMAFKIAEIDYELKVE